MLKKILSIIFILLALLWCVIFLVPHDKCFKIKDIISPYHFVSENGKEIILKNIETFDDNFTERNKIIAKNINITEEDAFIMGNLAKYKAIDFMKGRTVYLKDNDLIFHRNSYKQVFQYTGFCLKNNIPLIPKLFNSKLIEIKKANYKVLDLDTYKIYNIEDFKTINTKNFLLIKKSQINKIFQKQKHFEITKTLDLGLFKVILTDSTTKISPDKNCSSEICKEILYNINNAKKSIDIAIYGYSQVPEIEKALISAQNRGVKIRLIYDLDKKGENIYPDIKILTNLIKNNKSDFLSKNANYIMHNKFYIFDNETLITGSANLSHTDMSGFNSNNIISIKSPKLAQIYKEEFEQMYNGLFHLDKKPLAKEAVFLDKTVLTPLFSPQDKILTNFILSLITNAQKYIYIPTFVLTEERIIEALTKAKQKGVDIKVIIDATSASIKHSKHNELRKAGIPTKTENYAGKMHSKTLIIDDKYTIIGSMNFSNSGENKNDENIIIIENQEVAQFYKKFFLYQWEKIDNKWLKYNVRSESKDSFGSCSDGIDNNYDGFIDFNDPACKDL